MCLDYSAVKKDFPPCLLTNFQVFAHLLHLNFNINQREPEKLQNAVFKVFHFRVFDLLKRKRYPNLHAPVWKKCC